MGAVAALGVDPLRVLELDHIERLFFVAAVQKAHEIRAEWRDDLAVRIINALSKAMKR